MSRRIGAQGPTLFSSRIIAIATVDPYQSQVQTVGRASGEQTGCVERVGESERWIPCGVCACNQQEGRRVPINADSSQSETGREGEGERFGRAKSTLADKGERAMAEGRERREERGRRRSPHPFRYRK